MKYVDMDSIYRNVPLERIPWDREEPPQALVDLVRSGTVRPCKAVDLGCGTGHYAIYLAQMGFEVTGVDISPTAIGIAQENARRENAKCDFIAADLLGDLHEVRGTYDFGYDWELLHHIFPEDRGTYVRNVHRLLSPGATYLSVCFSERDPMFGGVGKYRRTAIGTLLYFSSESEIEDLLSPYFSIQELKTVQIAGRPSSHLAIYALSKRR